MSDTGAGAHNLNVSRFDSAFVAETISVSDRTFADIDDDLDIGMHLQRKARVWRDLLVAPNAHATPATLRWIIFRCGGKVMPGFEPAEVLAWKLVEGSAFNHRCPAGDARPPEWKRKQWAWLKSFPCLRIFLPLLLEALRSRSLAST